MTLQERFAEAFPPPHVRGLQAEIMRACEVSRPTVSAWFNSPEKVGAISRAHAEIICDRFRLKFAPRWLAEGTEPKFANTDGVAERKTEVLEFSGAPSVIQAVHALALHLEMADEKQRSTAAALLESLARRPETVDAVAKGLAAILGTQTA